MKIAISANTDWYLFNFRRTLFAELHADGHEVILISPPGMYAEKLQKAGYRWLQWEVGRKSLAPWKELGALLRLHKIYREEAPDIVHHHTIKPGLYGSLAARMAGVPRIVNSITGRGYVFLGDRLDIRLLRSVVIAIYRFAYAPKNLAAIFENPTDKAYFLEHRLIDEDRTFLIPGVGVDHTLFTVTPEPEGTPIILMAARMLWDKGVGTLVEAARLLKRETDVRVVLAGAPDEGNPRSIPESTLREWTNEGVVEWVGFKENIVETYQKSHIIALPSNYAEGIPTNLMEAAACGRPVVTTDTPGCRDFVKDGVNGFLVPPEDPQSLAEALKKLVCDKDLRQKMGDAGRKRVMSRYRADKINAATMQVYRYAESYDPL